MQTENQNDRNKKRLFTGFGVALLVVTLISASLSIFLAFSNNAFAQSIKTSKSIEASVDDDSDPEGKAYKRKMKAQQTKDSESNDETENNFQESDFDFDNTEDEQNDEDGNQIIDTDKSVIKNGDKNQKDYNVFPKGDNIQTTFFGLYKTTNGYYDTLNEKQQKYYEIVKDTVFNGEQRVTFSIAGNVGDELGNVKAALHCVELDYPEFSWWYGHQYNLKLVEGTNAIELTFLYYNGQSRQYFDKQGALQGTFTEYDLKNMKSQTEQGIFNIVSKIPTSLRPSQKVVWLNDYLCSIIKQDDSNYYRYKSKAELINSASIVGVIKNKKGNCEGFAKLFASCCKMMDITCVNIEGTRENSEYLWNCVNLGNGWETTDVYYNAGILPVDGSVIQNGITASGTRILGSKELPHDYNPGWRSTIRLEQNI